jgi:muconolactone delta-isomerase
MDKTSKSLRRELLRYMDIIINDDDDVQEICFMYPTDEKRQPQEQERQHALKTVARLAGHYQRLGYSIECRDYAKDLVADMPASKAREARREQEPNIQAGFALPIDFPSADGLLIVPVKSVRLVLWCKEWGVFAGVKDNKLVWSMNVPNLFEAAEWVYTFSDYTQAQRIVNWIADQNANEVLGASISVVHTPNSSSKVTFADGQTIEFFVCEVEADCGEYITKAGLRRVPLLRKWIRPEE